MTGTVEVAEPTELLRTGLEAVAADPILATPDVRLFRALGDIRADADWEGSVRVVTTESTATFVRNEFLTAAQVSDLLADGRLEIRTVEDDVPLQPSLVGDEMLYSLVGTGEAELCMVGTDEAAAVDRLREDLEAHWADGEEYDLRTPAYSRMLRTLGEELDDQTRQDVQSVIESPRIPRSVAESLDEVDVALLMAARNERQLYRLSRWGEDIGLASPAKFSRVKRRLEDAGLVETEKVQVGMGRPRQRLVLSEGVAGLEPDEVISEARSALS